MLGSPILYLKGMRILMFQLSGFCFNTGDLIIRIGFPLKGFLKKGPIRVTIRGIMGV